MAEKTFHSLTLPGQDTARVPLTAVEFNTSTAYKVKDYCTYQGKLYRCTVAHAAGAWNASHFVETNVGAELDRKLDIPPSQASAPANPRVGDLWIDNDENSPIYNVDAAPTLGSTNAVQSGGTKTALNAVDSRKIEHGCITGDFSASVDYRVGDLVFYATTANGITSRTLYRCTTAHNAAAWNAAHFAATTLEVELQRVRDNKADTAMIGDLFGAKTTYAAGDYCIYNDNLYRCIQAVNNTGVATPAFDPDDWTQVTLANDVSDLKSALNIVNFVSGYITTYSNSLVIDPTIKPTAGNYKCAIINCEEGDTFYVSGSGGSGARLWCFTDKNWSRLTISQSNVVESKLLITAPERAAKLIVNLSTGIGYAVGKGTFDEYILNSVFSINSIDATTIEDRTDLNSLITPGNYTISSGSNTDTLINCPVNGVRFRMLVFENTDTTRVVQVIFPNTQYNDKIYYRNKITAGWTEWVQLATIGLDTIQDAAIHDMTGIYKRPDILLTSTIQERNALSTKASIFKNGNSFCVTFQENIDGTESDVPDVSDSGTTALRYKYFEINNNAEENAVYGNIVRKGDSYIDYNGETQNFIGGAGKPSGNNGMQFFTAAAIGTHRQNGKDNWGMVPCCCSVTVSNGSVSFGQIREMTLSIDGVVGKMDVIRINPSYVDYYIYYTTTAPAYDGSMWHWLLPVVNGIVYLTSSDAVNWTYKWTVKTPFQSFAEVACENFDAKTLIFAARCKADYKGDIYASCTVVGLLDKTTGTIKRIYKLNTYSVRPYIAKVVSASYTQYYLFTNLSNSRECNCIIITPGVNTTDLWFYKWFSVYHQGTWYPSCYKDELTPTQLYMVGTNGGPQIGGASTFISLNTSGIKRVNDVDYQII